MTSNQDEKKILLDIELFKAMFLHTSMKIFSSKKGGMPVRGNK